MNCHGAARCAPPGRGAALASSTNKRPAATLDDLVQLEKTAKEARHQYEVLSKAGAGGTFEVQPKGPFMLTKPVVVEVKPRSLYQRFYHHVTSKQSIQWLAAAYGSQPPMARSRQLVLRAIMMTAQHRPLRRCCAMLRGAPTRRDADAAACMRGVGGLPRTAEHSMATKNDACSLGGDAWSRARALSALPAAWRRVLAGWMHFNLALPAVERAR